MQRTTHFHDSFQSIFEHRANSTIKKLLLILLGVTFLGLSAHLAIPLQPVPLTFQSAAVVCLGMSYGWRLGSLTLFAYMLAGFAGLPVFASTATTSPLIFEPTVGYLIGFIPAAFIAGYLAEIGFAKTILRSFIASLIGASIIFACGIANLTQFMSFYDAITVGLMPFIFTEPLKLFAFSICVPKCWKQYASRNA